VVGVNRRRSAENRVYRQYWTGVPVHEYEVIMPGGMTYGLRSLVWHSRSTIYSWTGHKLSSGLSDLAPVLLGQIHC
jgi:hypothetical protein